ncbi:MAG: hypothetical protein M8467_19140 [Anaerolineae bacterium]|nr:hypothetical protein [Anaerolineae bacterium]
MELDFGSNSAHGPLLPEACGSRRSISIAGEIHLLQDDADLQLLTHRPYDSEGLLKTLTGCYPNLLAGDQIGETALRRWWLLSREVGRPLEEGGR